MLQDIARRELELLQQRDGLRCCPLHIEFDTRYLVGWLIVATIRVMEQGRSNARSSGISWHGWPNRRMWRRLIGRCMFTSRPVRRVHVSAFDRYLLHRDCPGPPRFKAVGWMRWQRPTHASNCGNRPFVCSNAAVCRNCEMTFIVCSELNSAAKPELRRATPAAEVEQSCEAGHPGGAGRTR